MLTQTLTSLWEIMRRYRDVDNSREPGKLPGCERDFSGCKRQKPPEKELTLPRIFVEECQ